MKRLLAGLVFILTPSLALAANLDLSSSYRMKGLAYQNLNLATQGLNNNNHSFLTSDARFGVAMRKIYLETRRGEDTTMDIGVLFHAVGIAGSTSTLAAPFDRPAEIYPNAQFVPFLENAYVSVKNLWGLPWELKMGRQNFRLGSGLILDDDGAGLTGLTAQIALPWWGLRLEGFAMAAKAAMAGPNSLGFAGASIYLPSEGTWSLHQLFETDRRSQVVYGCSFLNMGPEGCQVSKARRSFTSVRYQINYGPIVFDGEAAIQRGAATPTGANPARTHIIYSGDAQVVKAKWKQGMYKWGEGIARISVARGSGDDQGTGTTDEAFFPSHGHRFEGMDRKGFGEFFGATPYDAFAGNYSTTTVSGLRAGHSGITAVSGGFTPPSYKGLTLDIDYYLYQVTRVVRGSRSLGSEWNFRFRYPIQEHFSISATAAVFHVGNASNADRGRARKYSMEVYGRF